ncbi:MAG: glycoside hydrolase family 27 protein [Flavobacteriaceae bacterium]|nr:glycoside hydrolase family 27 protein [Flavobacteriaceae bacterium]MCY4267044.1 glycoside hydrolase family 27 protein [Flavobacteriaceae bacterium]MCY4299874.1 glycoside hydrolase family 27 protein [Flavobacteriaceae bacterium]
MIFKVCVVGLLLIGISIQNGYSSQTNISNHSIQSIERQDTILASSPPMGWNSWNYFGKHRINQGLVKQIIDSIADHGLKDAGYEYVVIDGGWRDTKLGPQGQLLSHPEKFPDGMKVLVDYAHSKGLKFGLHTVPGSHDCINDPVGGFGKEEIHVQQFVDWGIDFIKLDMCILKDGWTEDLLKETYYKWHRLLDEKSNHRIVLSISGYKFRTWNPQISQMSRTTGDISARVGGMSGTDAVFDGTISEKESTWKVYTIMEVAEENNQWHHYAGHGYWNDPDMLVTGDHGMSFAEQKSHFALWCIMSSPLMLGNNPLEISQEERKIILNETAIRINQDPTQQGKRMLQDDSSEVWAKKLRGGHVAVLLLNRSKVDKNHMRIDLKTLGIDQKVKVRDVYENKILGQSTESISYTINPQSSLFLLLEH